MVIASLSAAASTAAAWGAMPTQPRQDRPADLHHLVHQRLDLSPEQDRRLDEIEAAFAERRAPLEAEVRQANAELSAAIAASQGDTPEVQAAVDHFHTAMGDLQMATIRHVFEM